MSPQLFLPTAWGGTSPEHDAAARVVAGVRERYRVIGSDGEQTAVPSSVLRREAELPVVGDWVVLGGEVDDDRLIEAVYPRRGVLSRGRPGAQTREQVVAANVDAGFAVMGLDGDANARRLARLVAMIAGGGVEPVVVLTKADLADDAEGQRAEFAAGLPGVAIYAVASLTGAGLDALRTELAPGRTIALVGSSGAGKSTLLNRLVGEEVMRTSAVRPGDDRGRHTTTHRELIPLPGGALLIDNPGVREIALWTGDGLDAAYADIARLAEECRFRDCSHRDEPGCAVRGAVDDGDLDAGRLAAWLGLRDEVAATERRRDEAARRRHDRALGRVYREAKRERRRRRGG